MSVPGTTAAGWLLLTTLSGYSSSVIFSPKDPGFTNGQLGYLGASPTAYRFCVMKNHKSKTGTNERTSIIIGPLQLVTYQQHVVSLAVPMSLYGAPEVQSYTSI